MVAWIGFNQTFVEYDRESRFAGETKYPLKKMLRLASDAILSFSNTPLKIATFVGFITSIAAFIGIIYSLYVRLFTKSWVDGWAFLMIAILLIGGIILIVLGVIGEYVGRIYGEIKQRPLYIVKDKLGFDK
jgi:dolichol-phosphate mannosyltransferase